LGFSVLLVLINPFDFYVRPKSVKIFHIHTLNPGRNKALIPIHSLAYTQALIADCGRGGGGGGGGNGGSTSARIGPIPTTPRRLRGEQR